MSTSLFELTAEGREIQDFFDNFDGDISDPEVEARIDAMIMEAAENEEAFKKKIDSCLWVAANEDAFADGRKAEAARLAELAGRNARKRDKLIERIAFCLKLLGKTEVRTRLHDLKFVGNGGKQAIEFDYEDVRKLPKKYRVQKWDVDKEKVREDLEAGALLPFARLKERGERLRIN